MSITCLVCAKDIYPMDPKVSLDKAAYHHACAKCYDCGCQITIENFTIADGFLLCKTHYLSRLSETGGKFGVGANFKHGTEVRPTKSASSSIITSQDNPDEVSATERAQISEHVKDEDYGEVEEAGYWQQYINLSTDEDSANS